MGGQQAVADAGEESVEITGTPGRVEPGHTIIVRAWLTAAGLECGG